MRIFSSTQEVTLQKLFLLGDMPVVGKTVSPQRLGEKEIGKIVAINHSMKIFSQTFITLF